MVLPQKLDHGMRENWTSLISVDTHPNNAWTTLFHMVIITIMGFGINAIELTHAFTEIAIGCFDQ